MSGPREAAPRESAAGSAEARDWRLGAELPWLEPARARLQAAVRAGRLPHALLIHGSAGLGKGALGDWIARLALCERAASAPCGECSSCTLHAAGNHPDLRRVGVQEDRKQVAIDDVRELSAALALKSYRGGARVGIIDPADAMNTAGANALLKTLEEPGAGALLILVVDRGNRLPATIASRCQRIALRAPAPEVARAWLAARGPRTDWSGPLALAAGAPLAALDLAHAGAADLHREMAEVPGLLARSEPDVVALAERWAKQRPADRLRWIENWVTDRIRRALPASGSDHTPATPGLPAEAPRRHIQDLYGLLDETRAAQRALRGSANVQLLLERVLLAVSAALGPVDRARAR